MRPFLRAMPIVLLVVLVSSRVVLTQTKAPQTESKETAVLARGRYIVDRVSMCGDCHTPRNEKGELDMARYLCGADMGVQPIVPIPVFNRIASDITAKGLAGWSIEDLTKAFETGTRPTGEPFRPPMPGYRMTRRDAHAVARYLKSVDTEKK